GDSPGILSVSGDLTLEAGSNFVVDVNGTTPGNGGFDQVQVAGNVTVSDANLLTNFGAPFSANTSFTLIQATGTVTEEFAGYPNNTPVTLPDGRTLQVTYNSNSVVLTVIQATTTTDLAVDIATSVFEQPVTFTATITFPVGTGVTTTPGGSVNFSVDGK